MSETVDWGPAPAAPSEGASNDGSVDNNISDNQSEDTGSDQPAETRTLGIPEKSKTGVDVQGNKKKESDSGRGSDTERDKACI